MVYRYVPRQFSKFTVKRKVGKWVVNELPTTFNDAIYPRIPFLVREKRYRVKSGPEVGGDVPTQFYGMSFNISDLFRDERVVLNYNKGTEIRPYVERLIVEAMRHGDRHKATMDMANFWLREKNLIHKLFKVFVPRYENYPGAFTAIHMLGHDYDFHGTPHTERSSIKYQPHRRGQVVLEMRGNSLPPVPRPKIYKQGLLTNILLEAEAERRRAAKVE